MQHLRQAKQTFSPRTVLAAPDTGIENCTISLLQLAAEESWSLSQAAERLVLVIAGSATVHADGLDWLLKEGGFVWLPRGFAEIGAIQSAQILEISLPTEQAETLCRQGSLDPAAFAAHDAHAALGRAFDTQSIIDGKSGAGARIFAAVIQPGSGMGLHIHPFDQFYFILSGRLHFAIGTAEQIADPGSLVVFPAGTAHRNWNEGSEPVVEITINIPEPAPGVPGVRHLSLTEI